MKKIAKKVGFLTLFVVMQPVLVYAQWNASDPNLMASDLPGSTGGAGASIYDAVFNLMEWVLGLIGALAIIAFVIAGIMYLTSAGDEGRAETAKKAMIYAIIGTVVALIGLIMVIAIDAWLNGSNRF